MPPPVARSPRRRPLTDAQYTRALERAVAKAVAPRSPGGATLTRAELLGLPAASSFAQQDAWLTAVDRVLATGAALGRGAERVVRDARQATRGTLRTVDARENARALAPLCAALDQVDAREVTFRPLKAIAALFPPRRFGRVYELPATPGAAHREFVAVPEGTRRRPVSGFGWETTVLMPERGYIVRQAVDGELTASPLVHLLCDTRVRGTYTAPWPAGLRRGLRTPEAAQDALAASPEAREAVRFAVAVAAVSAARLADPATRDAFARLWASSTLRVTAGAQSPTGAPELRVVLERPHHLLGETYETASALVAFERDGVRVSVLEGTPLLEALWAKAVASGAI